MTDEEASARRRYRLYKERQRLTLEPSQGDRHRAFFNRVRHMMPERDRFARTLFRSVPLRSSEGRSALQDLIALYENDCRVAYQPGLKPVSGCCPVSSCARPIQRLDNPFPFLLLFHSPLT